MLYMAEKVQECMFLLVEFPKAEIFKYSISNLLFLYPGS